MGGGRGGIERYNRREEYISRQSPHEQAGHFQSILHLHLECDHCKSITCPTEGAPVVQWAKDLGPVVQN